MKQNLKQFVPSAVCLKCDGCCRFQSADSTWRPKWDKKEFVDDKDYITTIVDCGKHLCRFLNKADSTCLVYAQRPFECALYPFLLSQGSQGLDVYVHLACPFVQEHQSDETLDHYIAYLNNFFNEPATKDFLRRQKYLVQDYIPYLQEMRHVLTIQDPI